MENLTKQQIVLVTLLVSFVTSIATGIFTVSLMEQAPPAITQTINRVIERTVEKVTPVSNSAAVVTKETVVVKADDLVIAAVEKNSQDVVRINESEVIAGERKENFGALGIIVSSDGIIATDNSILNTVLDGQGNSMMENYIGVLSGGKSVELSLLLNDTDSGLAFFEIKTNDDKGKKNVFAPVSLGDSDSLKLGQTVVSISGAESNTISTGIISSLSKKNPDLMLPANATSTGSVSVSPLVYLIRTDYRPGDIISGATILNLSGEVIGINAGQKISGQNVFLPSNFIKNGLSKIATMKKQKGSN